jgi:hypothetical protein
MLRSSAEATRSCLRGVDCERQIGVTWKLGAARGIHSTGVWTEASRNWLAFGLLLAAWNAVDSDPAALARRRPEPLRGYSYVSVRAATHYAKELSTVPTQI